MPVAARRTKTLLLMSCAFGALVAPAAAQEAIVLDAVTLEGARAGSDGTLAADSALVVPKQSTTSTKGAGSRLASPQPVSVIGRDQIEVRNVQTVDEATRYSSGVQGQKFGSNNRQDWYNIRGFAANADGLFLDGLALFSASYATWQVDPVTLERVEVMKGPASVLYGGSSPGGLVNLTSKRPTKTTQGSVEVGVNEYGQGYTALDSSGPLDEEGIWTYRLNAKLFGGDYYADQGDEFRGLIAPTLTWAPDADTSVTVYGYYQRDDDNNTPGFLPYVGTVVPASYGKISRKMFTSEPSIDEYSRDQTMLGYEVEHSFDDTFTVRQKLRYAHLESTYALAYGNGLVAGSDTEISRFGFRNQSDVDNFTVDTQGEAKFSTGAVDHTVLAGVDYRLYKLSSADQFSLLPNFDVSNPSYGPIAAFGAPYSDTTQTLNQTGLYLQDQATYDRLVVTLNARYDFLQTELDDHLTAANNTDRDEGAFSGRAGAAYLFDNGLAPYVSYSHFLTPVLGIDSATGKPFDSGKGDQYEVGMKYQPVGFDSFFTASLFDLTRENVVTSTGVASNFQTGEIRSRGLELEGNIALTDGLSMLAAYTAMELEVTQSPDIDLGKVPAATPEQFASLWLDYRFLSGQAEGLRIGAGARYVGKTYADRANDFEVPDYVVFDAAISFEKNNWRASLNAANLFDKTTVSCGPSESACFYGEPRKVTASLAYKW